MLKKFFYVTLFLMLLTFPAQAERVTKFEQTFSQEGFAEAWNLLTPDYHQGQLFLEAGYAHLSIWSPDGPVIPTATSIENVPLLQSQYEVKIQETNGVAFSIDQIDVYFAGLDEKTFLPARPSTFEYPIEIPAYGSFSFGCGSLASNPRYYVYVVSGTDENGHELEFYGLVERLLVFSENETASVSANADYDTANLRYNADFEEQVADNVWWVPVRSLGESAYTNAQIAEMVSAEPEEKQSSLHTLYEALQMFQISGFYNGNDNVRIVENGIDWEHHKPGYDAVRTNTGCCATDSNWLNYILREDYEEVGFIAYSQSDGSGHVFNYIFHEGFYYIIDLTHYRTDFLDSSAPETGSLSDYQQSDFISGNLHKAASIEDFVRYCVSSFNDPPELFFYYRADDCLPVTSTVINGCMTIVYPETYADQITALRGASKNPLNYAFIDPPTQQNDWSTVPSALFVADMQYVNAANSANATEPLTDCQPGDVLSIVTNKENNYVTVDGQNYRVAQTNTCRYSFRGNFSIFGGFRYSYCDMRLPTLTYQQELSGLESVVLGNGTVEFSADITHSAILIGVQHGDELEILQVLHDQNAYGQTYAVYRNAQGDFEPTPIYWYLMIYEKDGQLFHQFARFFCDVVPE